MDSKSKMMSFRLSSRFIARIDFITRNTPDDALASRAGVIRAALESWLPGEETRLGQELERLGVPSSKRK